MDTNTTIHQTAAMFRWLIPFCALTSSAFAGSGCDDLWFTRNLIFDRAGFCFSSTLGNAVFDNSNCTSNQVDFDERSKQFIKYIRDLETALDCHVDTSRNQLDFNDIAIRFRLQNLPIRDEFESGCLGWQQADQPLYAGRDTASAVIGRITSGDYVLFAYISVSGWSYVTTYEPVWGPLKSGGWMQALEISNACRDWAG